MYNIPPNNTSKIQPMDQGIIKNFTVHHHKRILMKTDGCSLTFIWKKTIVIAQDGITECWPNDIISRMITTVCL